MNKIIYLNPKDGAGIRVKKTHILYKEKNHLACGKKYKKDVFVHTDYPHFDLCERCESYIDLAQITKDKAKIIQEHYNKKNISAKTLAQLADISVKTLLKYKQAHNLFKKRGKTVIESKNKTTIKKEMEFKKVETCRNDCDNCKIRFQKNLCILTVTDSLLYFT